MKYSPPFGQKGYRQDELIDWSSEELDDLKRMYPDKRYSFSDICNKLQRSRGAVAGRARKLGLKRPPGGKTYSGPRYGLMEPRA